MVIIYIAPKIDMINLLFLCCKNNNNQIKRSAHRKSLYQFLMLRNLQASFRQLKGFALPQRVHNMWVQYFTASTPKSLHGVPINSPIIGHFSNFNFTDINMKTLLTESSAIKVNPADSLPLMLHFEQPISPHYFKFCITIDGMKIEPNVLAKVAQEVGPQMIRALCAFTFQLEKNLDDILAKKSNPFFPLRFLQEIKYLVKLMMNTNEKLFNDFLYLLNFVLEICLSVQNKDSLIFDMAVDISSAIVPFCHTLKAKCDELKPVISFISKVFLDCKAQDQLFVDFCNALCTNEAIFPDSFTNEAYVDLIHGIEKALLRISSKKPDTNQFAIGLSFLKTIGNTLPHQKQKFAIVPSILRFIEWTTKITSLPPFEVPEFHEKSLIDEKSTIDHVFEFTSLDLFDESSIDEKTIEIHAVTPTYFELSPIFVSIIKELTQICNHDDVILKGVINEFPKKGIVYIYLATAIFSECKPERVSICMQQSGSWKLYCCNQVINEETLMETFKNKYLINLKDLLLNYLAKAQTAEVPTVLSKLLDINHPIIVFKIVQLFNMLSTEPFLTRCMQSPAFDAMMRIYQTYRTYLINNKDENEDTIYMKKCKSAILKFVLAFSNVPESSLFIIANGRRIEFILSLLFENKSFNTGMDIIGRALQHNKIGLLMRHINSLIKTGFDHLELNEWRNLYSLLFDCIANAVSSNRINIVKKFIGSGSIAVYSKVPIAFENVENSREHVLTFLNKILQLFSTLGSNSYLMIKELSNPQWGFVNNMVQAIRFVDVTKETIDLLTRFTTIGNTLWITTGIELLFVAAESESVRDSTLKMLVGFVDDNDIANRYQCYEANALTYLLKFIEKTSNDIALEMFSLVSSTYFRMNELSLTLRLLSNSTEQYAIPLLQILIKNNDEMTSNLTKSFFHLTTQNTFTINSFHCPPNFLLTTNVYFPEEMKNKTPLFTMKSNKQKLTFVIIGNKFFLEIHNKNTDNSFQLYTGLKPRQWIKLSLDIQPSKASLYIGTKLETASVIPSKFKFTDPITFAINNIKCDIEYIKIISKEYSFFMDFNAKCVNNGFCVNTVNNSPVKEACFDGLAVPYTVSFIDSIITCGGPRIFLPLFEKVCSKEFLNHLLTLINGVVQKNEELFSDSQFFRALAHILLNTDINFISNEVIDLLYTIYKSFTLEDIKIEMLQHIFYNFSIWKRLSKESQLVVYTNLFTNILQVDPSLFSNTIHFDELLLKFELMYCDEEGKGDVIRKTTDILLQISQNVFSKRDAQILIGSLMQNPSNEICLSTINLAMKLIGQNTKELIDYLKEIGFLKPFLSNLISPYEITRIISFGSAYYIQSLFNLSEMSIEMIDSIRLLNSDNTTDLSMINLMTFMTKSIKYNEFPRITESFDFDTIKVIEYPQFLPLFCQLITICTQDMQIKCIQYIRRSYIKLEESRKLIKNCDFWVLWLLFLSNIEDNTPEWDKIISSILNDQENIQDAMDEIFFIGEISGVPMSKMLHAALYERFIAKPSIELANSILTFVLYKSTAVNGEQVKDNNIAEFCKTIMNRKRRQVKIEFNKKFDGVCLKYAMPTTRFLIQKGFEYLSKPSEFRDINFTLVCYMIEQIGYLSKVGAKGLLHSLLPLFEKIDNKPEYGKGLIILLNFFGNQEQERDEIITILKKVDSSYSTMSLSDIAKRSSSIKNLFVSGLSKASASVESKTDQKMKNINEKLNQALARSYRDDSDIVVDVRSEFSREVYEISQDIERSLRKNHKFLKTILKYLNLQNGGPWFSIPEEPHYKFDNMLDAIGRRSKLVLNRKFKNYLENTWAQSGNDEETDNSKKVKKLNLSSSEQVESPNVYSITLECQMVTVLNNFKGTMYVSKSSIYFEAKETTDAFGDLIDKTSKLIEIPNDQIKFILKRRYLCLDFGIELFTIFNRSFYFVFSSVAQRTKFFKEIENIKPSNLLFVQTGDPAKIYKDLNLGKRWSSGEMTNYEYLWWLNILGNRSIHDISQYPIFPWILQDYKSKSICLSKASYYRDLSKPVGALNEERLTNLRFLFNETKGTPFACLYRFHYSAPAYVILFLLRKEPFTTLHIQLQNDHFDHPNRLFFSVSAAWDSITSTNSDFRELIPEFFATPEFLINSDNYDLGTRFDFVQMARSMSYGAPNELNQQVIKNEPDEQLSSLIAHDDTNIESDEEFTSLLNPDAIADESLAEADPADIADGSEKEIEEIPAEKISNNLRNNSPGIAQSPSISNFVGLKIIKTKKGQMIRRDFKVDDVELPPWASSAAAFTAINRLALESKITSANLHKWIDLIFGVKQCSEEADNVFHPFSYPDAAEKEPDMLQTIQQHAANFGVSPNQLFSTPHKPREFIPQQHSLQDVNDQQFLMFSDVTQFGQNENMIKLATSANTVSGMFEDGTFRTYSFGEKNHLVLSKSSQVEITSQLTPMRAFITKSNQIVFSPPWSQSFNAIDTKSGKKWTPSDPHSAAIKTISCDGDIVVTGAGDSSLFVWDVQKKKKITTIVAHTDPITAVSVSSELELVVSCDQRGTMVFSSMRTGNFIRKIKLEESPKNILISSLGFVVLIFDCVDDDSHSSKIQLLDINGRQLKEVILEGKTTSSIIMTNQDLSSFFVVAQETKLVYILRIYDFTTISMGPVTGFVKDMDYSMDDLSLYFLLEDNSLLVSKFNV
ncbi:hypothetical protein TRFO_12769 [Tritrichomonas foetus]|uniref:Beige/BEACH domain containing protein n=1 Tax=Tritrichomonas foetus TaxID=1144522 RepID=A0A1J4L0U1_9EUKA|nr:hypothetical protein TRFO_12769 [Tritrichomonas foetus]|eukprot:OHT17051.1 hypothetical protein TRFO_12769 [Tritrichomonas foetus]